MVIEIWVANEYLATGMEGNPSPLPPELLATIEAESFDEACETYARNKKELFSGVGMLRAREWNTTAKHGWVYYNMPVAPTRDELIGALSR